MLTMKPDSSENPPAGAFIICGLGDLGRQCAALLKEFGGSVIGVDQDAAMVQTQRMGLLLDRSVVGDCCQAQTLIDAGIGQCRAALLVTSDERNNIAAAFMARSLNPHVRLIIRSAQENLNALLKVQLGNLVAFEPSQFSADAFALASLGQNTRALFEAHGVKMRLAREVVGEEGEWRPGRPLIELQTARRRILSHHSGREAAPDLFFPASSNHIVQRGDILTFVESGPLQAGGAAKGESQDKATLADYRAALAAWSQDLRRHFQIPRAALVSFVIMLGLALAGTLLFHQENPEISWFDATNVAIVLAIGGFDNVFGALKLPFPITPNLYAFSVLMTVSSTVFLGVVFATLTGFVLSARLQIARRRPAPPPADHVIVIGLGPIGQKIARILRGLRQPLVGVSENVIGADVLPELSIQFGPLREALLRAKVASAISAIVVLDDQVANLEVSLLVKSLNPDCAIVFRTADQQLAQNVASLIPASTGISDYAIAAEAIAGAAFGENISSAFHLDERSALVTEYLVQPGDTLISRTLATIAYGYGVAPVLYKHGDEIRFNPPDDIRLEAGDQIVVLATVEGLRRVEHCQIVQPDWVLWIDTAPSSDAAFDAANLIARLSGCSLALARSTMSSLPARLDVALYEAQGTRLARELKKLLVHSRLERSFRPAESVAVEKT